MSHAKANVRTHSNSGIAQHRPNKSCRWQNSTDRRSQAFGNPQPGGGRFIDTLGHGNLLAGIACGPPGSGGRTYWACDNGTGHGSRQDCCSLAKDLANYTNLSRVWPQVRHLLGGTLPQRFLAGALGAGYVYCPAELRLRQ
ncbi:hypothetical protein D3C77_433180 [compost metagenome]